VVDSREVHDASVIRRRRECGECNRRFTSYERIEEIPYMVVKKDGRRERFDRQKLLGGLLKACQKRPVALKTLEALADGVENLVQERADREIGAPEIGSHVMAKLREIDQVAYVRFASVYRRFEDIQEFMSELQGLLKKKES
jgi:transcriptional repressor NrdR